MVKLKMLRVAFVILGPVLAGTFLVLAVLPLLGPIWHLWHGDSIIWQEWKVFVPKGFCVRGRENPTMWKLAFGAPLLNSSYGHVSLFHRPADQLPFEPGRDLERLTTSVTEMAKQDGYRFSATRELKADNTLAYCLEFENQLDDSRAQVRCAIEDSRVVIFYEGATRYVPEFLSIFGSLSREKVQ